MNTLHSSKIGKWVDKSQANRDFVDPFLMKRLEKQRKIDEHWDALCDLSDLDWDLDWKEYDELTFGKYLLGILNIFNPVSWYKKSISWRSSR